MNNNKKDALLIALGLFGSIAGYFVVMWLITDVGVSPIWFSLVIIYLALVYPQKMAMDAMKAADYYEYQDEYDFQLTLDKSNWIVLWNDLRLVQYFGGDNLFKKIVSTLLLASIPVMLLSTLYVNLLVVFFDLGATFAYICIYSMFISIIVYYVTKCIITGYFLMMYGNNPMLALTAVVFPLGFFVINLLVKKHFIEIETVRTQDSYGESFE